MTDATDPEVADQAVSLSVFYRADIDFDRARAAFADLEWLGQPVDPAPASGWRRIATDLELPIRNSNRPAVRKAAFVDIGPARWLDEPMRIPIAWRSASLSPLFPVLAGHIEIGRRGLTLTGRYAPPFGRLGLLIDRGLLHFVARRTALALLARVANSSRQQSAVADSDAPASSP